MCNKFIISFRYHSKNMEPNGPPRELPSLRPKPGTSFAKPTEKLSSGPSFDLSKLPTDRYPTTAQSPLRSDEYYSDSVRRANVKAPNSPSAQTTAGVRPTFVGKRCSAAAAGMGTKDFFEKQYQYYKVHNEQLGNAIKEAVTKELEECTFDPVISGRREFRSFSNFLIIITSFI